MRLRDGGLIATIIIEVLLLIDLLLWRPTAPVTPPPAPPAAVVAAEPAGDGVEPPEPSAQK
jgi:hypothetical protein